MRIEAAKAQDKEEILRLYKAQIGREFCPWTEEYPDGETIDFDLGRDSLFVLKAGIPCSSLRTGTGLSVPSPLIRMKRSTTLPAGIRSLRRAGSSRV